MANYNAIQNNGNHPYGAGDPYYNETSNWIKFGIPVAVLVIVGAVVGGVVGSRSSKSSNNNDASSSSSTNSAAQASAATFTTPTFVDTSSAANAWPKDSFSPSSPSVTSLRSDRPRLIAPALDPVVYHMDGDSGILDNAREVKMRIKAFAYVYRMTNDTKWVDRCWEEIQNAAGNGTTSFGPTADKWNTGHFLDTAEFSSAFAIAYDWLYDVWTDDQKTQMRYTLNLYGLGPGVAAYNDPTVYTGWWRTNTTGNWNCVCNAGLTMASLAILGDDTTTNAETLLGLTVDNALQNCAQAVTDDGTWAETANYWYFGTTGHAEMSSALLTATGSDYGLLDNNVDFKKTGDFHMYVFGPTSLFDWGDHGPNKFSSTANSIIWYGTYFDEPVYTLFQREQHDAPEPWSMFWYDPTVVGAFWDGKPLDSFFDNQLDQWTINALYTAMKAGKNQGHQTHNDLDVGDFVLDALGTRWAGELGSGDYPISDRWKYYRKMTEGQNTILIGKTNQDVLAEPTILKSGTSNTTQGSSTVFEADSDSTAFWVADTTSAYFNATSVKRGVRMLNKRKQVLVQDEVTSTADIQWRMHTNATITTDGSKATLVRDGKTLEVSILSPSGATFTTSAATRFDTDPTPPDADQANPGITVLIIELTAGTNNIQVLFNPQWNDGTTFVTPSSVDLDNWSLTSHN
ncbi:chondroitin AC/alginate lyase [Armillaria novae-zelandiae]|uniref:Chondroitin AC/alginate lyase n=1 Tax=Armillaria novae-zelandiae TaxID=153914 RepID=A0AA39TBM3_9AGAR|nr:chondroitin AC/alginate lyase [Armillaria novae-zelandiae]